MRASRPILSMMMTSVLLFACLPASLFAQPQSSNSAYCTANWAAEFVSVEGEVDFKINTETSWQHAEAAVKLCYGDSVRVLEGKAHMRLRDNTLLVLDSQTNASINQSLDQESSTLIDLLRGLIHVISRDPRSLEFTTPFVNAGLEGTEFSISTNTEESLVTVIEGEVSLSNAYGQAFVGAGSIGKSMPLQPPQIDAIPSTLDSLALMAYLPPILDSNEIGANDSKPTLKAKNESFFAYRAAARIEQRRIAAARTDVAAALLENPQHPLAQAIQILLELHSPEMDSKTILQLAQNRLADDLVYLPSVLVLSYAEETAGEIDSALNRIERASVRHAMSTRVWTRLSELHTRAGNGHLALRAAERALEIDPNNADALTASGFAYLMLRRLNPATDAFTQAIDIKPDQPYARMGAALVLARHNQYAAASRALETAVALAPANALIRSQMAALYTTLHRNTISDDLLDISTMLDPRNSTAWLQTARNSQQKNNSVEAVWALQQATGDNKQSANTAMLSTRVDQPLLNNNGIGRIFRNLGFQQQARELGRNTVVSEPLSSQGHRLLADIYSMMPRHQIARANEHYMALMLQPSVNMLVQPHFAEANLFLLDQLGPSDLAFTDLTSPLVSNGIRSQISATGANNNTEGIEFLLSGGGDRLGFNAGYLDFSTNGFHTNSDFDQRVASAVLQFSPSDATNLFIELRSLDIERGDVRTLFNREVFLPQTRRHENSDAMRIGLNHRYSDRNSLLVLASIDNYSTANFINSFFTIEGERSSLRADLQHVISLPRWKIRQGLRLTDTMESELSIFDNAPLAVPPLVFSSVEEISGNPNFSVLYSYATREITDALQVTTGLEVMRINDSKSSIDTAEISPKLGLIWQAKTNTTFRAAVNRTANGPALSKYAIDPSLAPTHIAGFNQQYFGSLGETALQKALSLRHQFSPRLQAGIELVHRDLETPIRVFDQLTNSQRNQIIDHDESQQLIYAYWTPTSRLALSAEYQREIFNNNGSRFENGYARLNTRRLPLTLSYFHPKRISTRLTGSWVKQDGDFVGLDFLDPTAATYGEDSFWVWDLESVYRLPRRRGDIGIRIANLFDSKFQYQDSDPENPRIMPERMISFRFTLNY